MPYIIALDQGTTSSRAIVFDHDASIVAVGQREFRQIFPRPGWVEHDPGEIWATQISVATEALGRAHLRPRDIAAIGITNQRETTVVWDRETGEPVYNAIVWQDRRTADFCDRLKRDGHEDFIRERTGLVIDAYFSGSKIAWILDNVPGARARAEAGKLAFGTIDSWLVWQLTSDSTHITDVTNASRTMLFNINTLKWDDDLLRLLRVPASMLPEVRSSSEIYGRVSTTLGAGGVPIAGIAGDQQAALFGQMCVSPGLTKNTYGTGCFLLQNTGERPAVSRNRLLSTVAWQVGGKTMYALEGSVFIGGAVVQWLRDGLGIIRESSEVEALALSVPDSGGVYLVPAFAGLGAPHWDPYARGTIVGITRGTKAAHIARAAAGEHRVSGRRPARSGTRRCRNRSGGTARRRRRGSQQLPAAVSGRPARRGRRAAESDRDDGAGRSVPCRPGGWLLGLDRRTRPPLARRQTLRAVNAIVSGGGAPRGVARGVEPLEVLDRGESVACAGPICSSGSRNGTIPGTWSSSAAAPPALASRSMPRAAATTFSSWNSMTSAKARRAGAPSSCTGACVTSNRATSRW